MNVGTTQYNIRLMRLDRTQAIQYLGIGVDSNNKDKKVSDE